MTNKKKILIIEKVHEKGMELIKNHPNFIVDVTEDISEENLKTKIADCDGVAVRIAELSADIMNKAKNLKIISRHGVGYDNIDLKNAKDRDVKIAITANANAVTVAEHVFFNVLYIAKRKDLYDKIVREGKFKERNKLPKTIEVWKKNFLIVGFGRIGQALIKRCLGFEMNVYIFDPFVSKEKIESMGGNKVENLGEIVKKMDVISLHMPLTEKTKNLINYDLLKKMKNSCIIINAARGGIVNEIDLDKALNENLLFGAGIDVFEKEPPENNNPLLKNDKVFLSPHAAAFTEECMIRMGVETIQNIIDFFDEKLDKSKIVKL
tara:strand:+ start:1314 stop:2279 length:966 start_codon:yes stop_codon:yes gene_type:complete